MPLSSVDQSVPSHLELPLRRFTVAEYRRLGAAGILSENDRVELLDGLIATKMIHSPRHDVILCLVEQLLRQRLVPPWIMRVQCAVTLSESEPEPDLAIVLGPAIRYLDSHPHGADIRLVVEIADSSVARDLVKAGIYASADIPEYWLVNLPERQLQRYQSPMQGKYQTVSVLRLGDQLDLCLGEAAGEPIAISDIFPQ